MAHHLDSTDHLLEAEAIAYQQRERERTLRICLGDTWPLIEAKLRESEEFVDARMALLERRITRLEAERASAD
jgi:hypothetical protein